MEAGYQVFDRKMLFLALPALWFIMYFSYHKTAFNALSHVVEK